MKRIVRPLLASAGLVAIAVGAAALPAGAAPTPAAPAGRYIVRTDTAAGASALARALQRDGGDVDHVYAEVFPGVAATLTARQVRRLRADDAVAVVVPDQRVHATTVQSKPVWGLDRVDQRGTAGNASYRYDTTGKGVTAFLLDTGLRTGHHQFGSRAVSGYDFVDGDRDAADCEGHGTHVAGTVGGSSYGVAKGVKLVSVRVLDCDGGGYVSDIMKALDWVVAHKPSGPAVVNLSLGGDAFPLLDRAVERTVAAGVPVVVAAGNDDVNACEQSPARAPQAITVAATGRDDRRAPFSNFGRCVDLFAPGVDIRSASNRSSTAAEVMSGTSMAAPHVTGVVARYLQSHPRSTPAQTTAALLATTTPREVGDRAGSPDRLLYAAPAATAPGVPTRVTAKKADAARTATLAWSPPAHDGGKAVTGYRVTRNGKDARGAGPVTVTVPASARSHTFAGLRTGSGYTLTVRAVNALGTGATVSQQVAALR